MGCFHFFEKNFRISIDSVTMLRYNECVTMLRAPEKSKKGGRKMQPEENLISKKLLLEKYSISYGALYRWKRKGLIPEEWFIKKSTVTGQETFFPKDLIFKRVELILSNKEDILLDELAKKISGDEENNAKIVIDTVFGEKTFRIKDIKSIKRVLENGESTDLSEILKI